MFEKIHYLLKIVCRLFRLTTTHFVSW